MNEEGEGLNRLVCAYGAAVLGLVVALVFLDGDREGEDEFEEAGWCC